MTSNGSGYTRTTHEVEGQNDDRLEGLLGKVKVLKDVSRSETGYPSTQSTCVEVD